MEIMRHSAQKIFNRGTPSYVEWKQIVQRCPSPTELQRFLPTWFPINRDQDAMLLSYKEKLDRNPLDEKRRKQFIEFCAQYNNIQSTIAAWVDLIDHHPYNNQFQQELALACRQLKDTNFSAEIWRKLVENHPTNISLVTAYTRALIRKKEIEKG
jgi:hypothetical protein